MSSTSIAEEVRSKNLVRSSAHWRRVRLEDIAVINPRRSTSLDRSDDELTTFVPMEAVDGQSGTISSATLRPFGHVKKGYTYFEENDVIFAKITPCMQNGKHAVCRGLHGGFGFGSTEFHVLRPGPELRSEWLHYFLRQPELLDDAQRHFTGTVGQQRLPEDYLHELEILLPPLTEQEWIAAELTAALAAVDTARRAAQERLAAAEALPTSYLRTAFETIIGDLGRLDEVAEIQLGKMLSQKSRTGKEAFPYLRNANVKWGRFELSDIATMDFNEDERIKFELRRGDLLVCEGGEPGRAAIWEGELLPCYYQKALFRVRPKSARVDIEFLMYRLWYASTIGEFTDSNAKTTIAHLPQVRLSALEIALPPIIEQRQIARDLSQQFSAAEQLTTRLREELVAIASIPAALLRHVFNNNV